ncbi:HEPN domain-containing protein [Algoriphagus persicinus]|uniref:HEPN domain-containing protein n=1 Tax=Algoriphagus persicinus TaxID=3108754 RepID=UPI002B3CFE73|nr:HEPN domain-containing protein [Algoriphagus sp. E1-3-M2]MEB2783129.1 HEPN domain-containing protein [Algoriphagus sp. E1-3-M2]
MEINIEKQLMHWQSGAKEDLEVAELLIEKGRYLHGLFFCHLVLEKILKAHVVKITGQLAPRSHNLIYLSEKSGLPLDEETLDFLEFL